MKVFGNLNIYTNLYQFINLNIMSFESWKSGYEKGDVTERTVGYYAIATPFYQWGWGDSFHFARRWNGETFRESIKRMEYKLCDDLQIDSQSTVLDAGCGVGGPLCNIALYSGANVTGVTISPHQVKVGNARLRSLLPKNNKSALELHDFNQTLPFKDNTFDAVYSFEALCHAKNLGFTLGELYRVLKPGGRLAVYDWYMTKKFNPKDPEHQRIKRGIEKGNGIEPLRPIQELDSAVQDAQFNIEVNEDRGVKLEHHSPWYISLAPGTGIIDRIMKLHTSPLGRWLTQTVLSVGEKLWMVPKNSCATAKMLGDGAEALVKGGQWEIFTPSYFILATK